MSRSKTTAKESLHKESKTASLMTHQYSAISKHSSVKGTPKAIKAWLMSLPQDSRVNPSQSQESKQENPIPETNGRPPGIPLASFDRNTSSLRMSQDSFLTSIFGQSYPTLPKWGTIVDGELFPLKTQVRPIKGQGGGVWPTPTKTTNGPVSKNSTNPRGIHAGNALATAVNLWPSPTKQDAHNNGGPSQYDRNSLPLNAKAGSQLNPAWVCWLMGWPINWESLEPLTELTWLDWSVDPADLEVPMQNHSTPRQPHMGLWVDPKDRAGGCRSVEDDVARLGKGHGPIPRIATGVKDRVNRLKALGNGQVPQCMELAWRILSNEN